ncbi:hypothetical protein EXU57_06280 [Segetibacter sp. 3557_3]|uniref:hypothetical protein n=1 Tax=Segetibacter sp. 3557_3 TaxID=2547429 RepID=UPI001058C71A|nr:hypothetical protein [Segetibacter sp. 3557_3]TDH28067.1 hypothetical protein EXU57_06280 [Segetibacter sp. 3557_3]
MNRLLCLVLITMAYSCAKETSDSFYPYGSNPLNDTVWVAEPGAAAAVHKLEKSLDQAANNGSVNAVAGGMISFPRDLEMIFPPSAFAYPNGTLATGAVNLEVIYLKTKGDMVRFARPTTSFHRLLESGGAVHIKASKEGQELGLAAGKSIMIRFREPNTNPLMRVFYGEQNAGSTPPGTNSGFTWVPAADSSRVATFQRQDSMGGVFRGYEMISARFAWVNCDYFVDTSKPRTRVNAILPPNFTNTNTSVYAILRDQRIVVRLDADYLSRTFFAPALPIGSNVSLVALGIIGDQLYYGAKQLNVSADALLRLEPEKKTKSEINTFLDQL